MMLETVWFSQRRSARYSLKVGVLNSQKVHTGDGTEHFFARAQEYPDVKRRPGG
jgi:hypothetical protein